MTVWDHISPDDLTRRQTVETDVELECHSCGHRTTGYQMGELMVEHGWRLHSTGLGRPFFLMCGDCEALFAERRAA